MAFLASPTMLPVCIWNMAQVFWVSEVYKLYKLLCKQLPDWGCTGLDKLLIGPL